MVRSTTKNTEFARNRARVIDCDCRAGDAEVAIDEKLFRIYQEAATRNHTRRPDLARAVAAKKLDEFSYQRRGEKLYLTWSTIAEYVRLLVDYGLLDDDCQPLINAERVSKSGFFLTLGEHVESYVEKEGFSAAKMRDAARELLSRTPARLPTPAAVHAVLQVQLSYQQFSRALFVKAFQDRVRIHPKQKHVLIIPEVLYD